MSAVAGATAPPVTAPVDVLAVMDEAIPGWEVGCDHERLNDMREARAAVAKLIEVVGMFTRGMPLAYADNAAVVGNSNARLIEDMRAALADVGGAS